MQLVFPRTWDGNCQKKRKREANNNNQQEKSLTEMVKITFKLLKFKGIKEPVVLPKQTPEPPPPCLLLFNAIPNQKVSVDSLPSWSSAQRTSQWASLHPNDQLRNKRRATGCNKMNKGSWHNTTFSLLQTYFQTINTPLNWTLITFVFRKKRCSGMSALLRDVSLHLYLIILPGTFYLCRVSSNMYKFMRIF